MAELPVCFVSMPFGRKPDGLGGDIDFDLIHASMIAPAVHAAGLQPIRGNEDIAAGLLLRIVLQRLVASHFAVFDLTLHNPTVLYELGIRHALCPNGTILIARRSTQLPWDQSMLRVLYYELNAAGRPEDPAAFVEAFGQAVRASQLSPVHQLLPFIRSLDVGALQLDYSETDSRREGELRRRILEAKKLGAEELFDIEQEITDFAGMSPDIGVLLFDAYRARGAWRKMIELSRRLPPQLLAPPRLQEQLALALNRSGEWDRAEKILRDLMARNAHSSETCGILGRVYKDQWEQAKNKGDEARAETFLAKAIEAYLQGFEADWRDPYPGVNAVTLMDVQGKNDPRRDEILPVVVYATKRKRAAGRGDYWDEATLLELLVVADKQEEARNQLPRVLTQLQYPWMGETTARNLRLIREARERRGVASSWIAEIEEQLGAH
ncbi:MAG TPA: TRAFs-binding domain-containing protein [Thermoanaerobaculia bacterium]|nr:TRAFs-binding domain-containing protein [Thermoanaerobaculia bacterium]